ncbi:MAG: FAD-binding protein [Acidimicrobiia bacterium]|nr:FAD-binding protein [Acidimicrobiia bacterium]NDD96236.1 FAD-binding protein [Actinomycetota bacterium]NDE79621.1 FAD-binding protein [Actinomycetota bacterium]
MNGHIVEALRGAIGADAVRDTTTELALFGHDASNLVGRAGVVCYPNSTDQVRAIIDICRQHSVPFVARGSGTGLAGGATPIDGAVVVCTTKMNRILSVDVESGSAWVEPGVLNLDLTRHVAEWGLHFAPDPSSQQSCSIGGNVANNSGGPHCLADGVTSAHVLACDVVLSDGTEVRLGGNDPEPLGFDLRGAFVGSEGMFGIATAVCVRLTANPPDVRTMLLDFTDVRSGTDTVSAIIAAGMVPAALEMMDRLCLQAVEAYIHAGLPTDAAAALLVEVSGLPAAVEADARAIEEIGRAHGARTVRIARDEEERSLLWKGRKNAFGAIARIKPNYYLHDTVVPRRHLSEMLDRVYRIASEQNLLVLNVFHAGDGNLHPLLVFDKREPGVLERVHRAGAEIVKESVALGGVLSGEHGIGLEKRDYMPLMFDENDLVAQKRIRDAFDPLGLANPFKVLPSPAGCGDAHAHVEGLWV